MNRIYLIALLIVAGCSTTNQQKNKYSSVNTIAEFNQFIEDFEKNYIYLEDNAELWKCIKESYAEKISQISTIGEHILCYENLLNELYDNHIHLNTNTNRSYRLEAPIYVTSIDGKTYVKNVWQTQLTNAIQTNIIGAEVLTFNGIDFQEKIEKFPTHCHDKSNTKIREWICNKIIAGRRDENRILGLRLKNGQYFNLNIDSLKTREEKHALSIIDNQNVGLIRVNNALGNQVLIKEFETALSQMDAKKALVIDLRNTVSGGNTSVAEPIMGMFTKQKRPYQLYENHKEKYLGYVNPYKLNWDKPLYILVNRWTGSMGEGIAIGLHSMNRATIIGTEMARLAGGVKTIKFKNHDYGFQISFEKIFDIDGNPREEFVPSNYVEQTQIEKDEILEYTIEKIKL